MNRSFWDLSSFDDEWYVRNVEEDTRYRLVHVVTADIMVQFSVFVVRGSWLVASWWLVLVGSWRVAGGGGLASDNLARPKK